MVGSVTEGHSGKPTYQYLARVVAFDS